MESSKKSPKTAGKPIRCRAAIGRGAGEPLVIEEVMVAPPKAHEVRIRILCTSLCHSDVTFWKMKDPPGYFPRIFGHESTGGGCCLENSKCGSRVYCCYSWPGGNWISSCRRSKTLRGI
ncbi:Alcohol dehydrogenase-like [Actinidia chinensis var. chinensis]|uniref:Alcohol dehydrogenase-like n=1 Tax=Actinidia chinensis var. chinensis TaxID=1590841 RepID=A0A2R6PZG6_ACTCC|nr:Alcohol dehydrogenase-like [Actinidia chinensis var. chinensis]